MMITEEFDALTTIPSVRPRVVATILLDDCGELVVPAIESVRDQVDTILCIDTTPAREKNPTVRLARRVAGDKFVDRDLSLPMLGGARVIRRGWNGSAADARNFALAICCKWENAYALTLDTDERIDWHGLDLRDTLALNPTIDTWMVPSGDGTPYTKERVFKLPAKGRWIGRVHEGYFDPGHRQVLPLATFSEIGKTPAQYKARFERDIPLLLAQIAEQPGVARWLYYLGDTYHNLGRYEEAARAWVECATHRQWLEESAWACYRAAVVFEEILHRRGEASDAVGLGLARQVTPELAWYGSLLAHRVGRDNDAILLASLAVNAAKYGEERVSFRSAEAWTYKPYEVLRYAHANLGHAEEAEKFRLVCEHLRRELEGA